MNTGVLPPWAEITVAVLVLLGAALSLLGSVGLLRLRTFYERVHAPTLGSTLGAASILLASMLQSSLIEARPVLHELLLGALLFTATPAALTVLVRAALYRDRREGDPAVPPRRLDP